MQANPTEGQPRGFFPPQKASDFKLAGTLYVLAGVETILFVALEEALYPGYSIHANTLSDLGRIGAPTWMIVYAEGTVRSLCLLFAAYFLFRRTGKRKSLALFLIFGGFPIPIPENYVTIHSIGAIVLFVSGIAVMTVSYLLVRSRFRYFSLFLGILTLVATVTLFAEYSAPLVQQTLGPGGWERLIAYPILIWMIGFGSYLLAVGEQMRNAQR